MSSWIMGYRRKPHTSFWGCTKRRQKFQCCRERDYNRSYHISIWPLDFSIFLYILHQREYTHKIRYFFFTEYHLQATVRNSRKKYYATMKVKSFGSFFFQRISNLFLITARNPKEYHYRHVSCDWTIKFN